jgi:hypothetical protein
MLQGLDDAAAVTIPSGNGVTLCPGQASVVVAPSQESPTFKRDAAGTGVTRMDCAPIFVEADENTPRCVGIFANDDYQCQWTDSSTGVSHHVGYVDGTPVTTTEVDDLHVADDADIDGDLNVDGNLTVDGTCTGPSCAAQTACQVIPAVTSADDNMLFMALNRAVTITSVWCNYNGSAPSTAATFTLEDGSGNAMTITDTNPVCAGPGTAATPKAVTAANSLTAREVLRFDVTNTPNPATDTYMLCVSFTVAD